MSLRCIVCHVIEAKDAFSWNMSRPKIRKPAGHNNHAKLFLVLHAIHAVKVHVQSSPIACLHDLLHIDLWFCSSFLVHRRCFHQPSACKDLWPCSTERRLHAHPANDGIASNVRVENKKRFYILKSVLGIMHYK